MRRKIAVIMPSFMGGGAEEVCVWVLDALKDEYDISLFTFTNVGFDVLNDIYGTNILKKDIKIICPFSKKSSKLIKYIFDNIYSVAISYFFPIFQHLVMRYFKQFNDGFDLPISLFNEMDMGKAGIQYIHDVGFVLGGRIPQKISNFSWNVMKKNITITNSFWMAKKIQKKYNINTKVIYPPIKEDFPIIPWRKKENGFVCSGRLVKQKKIHEIINTLIKVRKKGYDVHLHITGCEGNPKYEREIKRLQKENSSWIFLNKGLSRKEYCEILARHKYGIHMRKEAFGIVIAEMVKAGCIPFVRSEGGQIEIIGKNKLIMFNDSKEAVKKIIEILSNEEKQKKLFNFLNRRAKLFNKERFTKDVQKIVNEFFRMNKYKK